MSSGDKIDNISNERWLQEVSNSALPTRWGETGVRCLAFHWTDETLIRFTSSMPTTYAGGGVRVKLGFTPQDKYIGGDSAVMSVAFQRMKDGTDNILTRPFATAKTVTVTEPDAFGKVKVATIDFSDGAEIDSIEAGDQFRIEIRRKVDNASDTLVDNALITDIELREL